MQLKVILFCTSIAILVGFLIQPPRFSREEFIQTLKTSPEAQREFEEGIRSVLKKKSNEIEENQIAELESRYHDSPIKFEIMKSMTLTEEHVDNDEKIKTMFKERPAEVLESMRELILNDDHVRDEDRTYLLVGVLYVEDMYDEKLDIYEKYLTMRGNPKEEASETALMAMAEIVKSDPTKEIRVKEFLKTLSDKKFEEQFNRHYLTTTTSGEENE